jgi:TorA maturation chaperone TorD
MVHTPPSTDAQAIEELLARSAVYQALAVLLRHPEAGLAAWRSAREHHRLPEILERLHSDERLLEAARRLAAILEHADMPELTRRHERTFGYAVQGGSPSYELEYGEEHSHRQPQELGDIAAFYTAFGLQCAGSSHERVDHIAAECEFVHFLLYKEACASDEGAHDGAQVCGEAARRFLADHLGRWAPAFALRLTRADAGDVLTATGGLLLGWMTQECARADVPLGSSDLPLRAPKEQDVGCAACALAPGAGADGP